MTSVASCLVTGFYSPINHTDSPQDESQIQNASTPVKNASCHITMKKLADSCGHNKVQTPVIGATSTNQAPESEAWTWSVHTVSSKHSQVKNSNASSQSVIHFIYTWTDIFSAGSS